MPDPALPLLTRFWLAWACFFRMVFDGRYAYEVRTLGAAPSPHAPMRAPSLPAIPPPGDVTPAMQLLAILQREGRLVDFLQQDIAAFSDGDIGATARVVHAGCRKALRAHADIAPVRGEDEGARVKIDAGYDADAVKLVGDVKGGGPWSGVVRHRGWRAKRLELPRLLGDHDATVLAPAEVELG